MWLIACWRSRQQLTCFAIKTIGAVRGYMFVSKNHGDSDDSPNALS